MSLDRLHVFKTVYECGNTADAAARLKVTRPAISQSLSKLEAELDLSLFTRLPRGLTPTPQGHQLAQHVGPLLDRLNVELDALTRKGDPGAGVLHIGAPQATGTVHMPRIIERFNRLHPNVEIHLSLENSTSLLTRLMKGELDMAVIDVYGGVELHRNFQSYCLTETLVEEIVVMTCSPVFYERYIGTDLSYDNLASLPYITTHNDALEIKSWFHNQFRRIPGHFKKQLITQNGNAQIDCACRHLGAVAHGSNLTQEYVDRGDLVEIIPKNRGEKNQISLAQLLDKKPSALEKGFIDVLKTYAADAWDSGV